MISSSMTVAAAAVICYVIYLISKWHVDNHCQDNPEIIWIWLDDDAPQKGHPVKTRHDISVRRYSLSLSGSC